MGVGGEGVDVGAIVRLLLLQVAIESSGLQSRTVSHLISEVEYDKCKHVTAVNSTKHGIESLAGVKRAGTFLLMEACDAFGLAERSVPSAESQMAVCFRFGAPGRQRPVWGRQGHHAGDTGGAKC